jgi:hypothetical protein
MNEPTIKYPKPKIMLIDMPVECHIQLRSDGFNVTAGSFGPKPTLVQRSEGFVPVHDKTLEEIYFKNYQEQEIIFIDLPYNDPHEFANDTKVSHNTKCYFIKKNLGFIDTRPILMSYLRDSFDKIFQYGGIFVIFACPRNDQKIFKHIAFGTRHFSSKDQIFIDNFSFLTILSNCDFITTNGIEISPCEDKSTNNITNCLMFEIKECYYENIIINKEPFYLKLSPMFKNKYGDIIGCLLEASEQNGLIFILPQFKNKLKVVSIFLKEILPELKPDLFPDFERDKWRNQDIYQVPSVIEFQKEKKDVEEKAKNGIAEIDKKIETEKNNLKFIYDILSSHGDELVNSLIDCFKFLEFEKVIDVDEVVLDNNENNQLQEDIRIDDRSTLLLIEAKGISGLPNESDVNQIIKYISRRRKELTNRVIQGSVIINHHKNIPPLERDHKNVFTPAHLNDAKSNDFTLLTTWDLFLLLKGKITYSWVSKVIQDLFYTPGRMQKYPTHYEPVGEIVNFYREINVVEIIVKTSSLKKGERVGYMIDSGFLEEEISSLQVDHKDVDEALAGKNCGIKTLFSKEQIKNKTIVYKVNKPQ